MVAVNGSSSAGGIRVSNEGHKGAEFSQDIEGATADEVFAFIKTKLTDFTESGIDMKLDEANKVATGKGYGAKFHLRASAGNITIHVDSYPILGKDKMSAGFRELVGLAPAAIAAERAKATAGGWQPPT